MAEFMYPLPHRPGFPVFGLDNRFDGFRWVASWNDREHLYTVTLGHGHPEHGPGVSVTTIHKTPEQSISDDASRGPTGYEDAWFDATTALSHRAFPDDKLAAAAILYSTVDHSRIDAADSPADLGPEWLPVTAFVDGVQYPAARRDAGGACAYLLDLPRVAIAVNGPVDMAISALALADQSHRLDRYR